MSPGEGWVSASWIELGAALATHRSVARVTPWARTAARTPSAMRSPSRLISRSIAKATGTRRIAMLEASPAILIRRSGACPVPLLMSCSRPEVVPCANAAIASSTATASTPTMRRMRSEGRCTRAGRSGSSPSTSSVCTSSGSSPSGPDGAGGAVSSAWAASSRSTLSLFPSLFRSPFPSSVRPASAAPGRDEAAGALSASSGCTPCCFIVSSWSRITGHRPHDGGMPHRHTKASGCRCGGAQSAGSAVPGRGKPTVARASRCRWGGAGWAG